MGGRRLLAAPDKFRGTATAAEIAQAMADAARAAGWTAEAVPVADGGEGLLDCFGGVNRRTTVTGPLANPIDAGWRLDGRQAVIEMAAASGLALAGGHSDPLGATTRGTGELIRAALEAGAVEVVVGAGGSATTDGGLGAVEVLRDLAPLDGSRGPRVTVATDVITRFVDAATVFGPQKGADPEQVALLTRRLTDLADRYRREFGVDVGDLAGGGAAGGLAGGLAALGAAVRPGFALVSDLLDLPARVAAADLVLTGEGRVDATSLLGKVTGSVVALCRAADTRVVVVGGTVDDGLGPGAGFDVPVVSLTARFGARRSWGDPVGCIAQVVPELLGT